MFAYTRQERAYLAPFVAFFVLIALGQLVGKLFEGYAFWMASAPQYWVYPLQTLVCGLLLAHGWPEFRLQIPARLAYTIFVGVLVFLIWIVPQAAFHRPPRLDGFVPHFFGAGAPQAINAALRFVRLVIVVPLLEEIFWRGFLLRYLINQDFTRVPFGAFSWKSFAVVTVGFCLEHSYEDYPGALLAGALYNLVAYQTRSLSSCVVAHAVTNLLLGIYIMRTEQWGFW
jgi:CAAX prenyl protease-like protein